jgi:aminoglycoside N3'-acetyltransferase
MIQPANAPARHPTTPAHRSTVTYDIQPLPEVSLLNAAVMLLGAGFSSCTIFFLITEEL